MDLSNFEQATEILDEKTWSDGGIRDLLIHISGRIGHYAEPHHGDGLYRLSFGDP